MNVVADSAATLPTRRILRLDIELPYFFLSFIAAYPGPQLDNNGFSNDDLDVVLAPGMKSIVPSPSNGFPGPTGVGQTITTFSGPVHRRVVVAGSAGDRAPRQLLPSARERNLSRAPGTGTARNGSRNRRSVAPTELHAIRKTSNPYSGRNANRSI
jgi:hypothetical protein